jgi:hypothetical protein
VCYTTGVKKAKKKSARSNQSSPADQMIAFTRRLLNVKKSEVDKLRQRREPDRKRG